MPPLVSEDSARRGLLSASLADRRRLREL